MRHMIGMGIWVLATIGVAACSSSESKPDDAERSEAGASGAPDGTPDGKGGDGGASGALPDTPLGGNGAAAPTEEELAAEIERVVGQSFTTPADIGGCELHASRQDSDMTPFIDAMTLSFEKNDDGRLILVSTIAAARLLVARTELEPDGTGWHAKMPFPTAACFTADFEEEIALTRAQPTSVHLELEGFGSARAPRRVTLSAEYDPSIEDEDEPVTSASVVATPDEDAPGLRDLTQFRRIETGETYWEDAAPGWEVPRRFEFDELLAPGWRVSIADDEGHSYEVAAWDAEAPDAVGVNVTQFFPDTFHWVIEARDLAGNESIKERKYTLPASPVTDGSFEGGPPSEVSDFPDGEVSASPSDAPEVTPIAGQWSFYSERGWVKPRRITRLGGATELRFSARLIGVGSGPPEPSLKVRTRLLEAGASAAWVETTIGGWQIDASASSAGTNVTDVREVRVPLASGNADVLVELDATNGVWLDSLRTE